jgi:hypothetical protein
LLFFATAVGGKDSILKENEGIQRIVEGVTRAFIDRELNVFPGAL